MDSVGSEAAPKQLSLEDVMEAIKQLQSTVMGQNRVNETEGQRHLVSRIDVLEHSLTNLQAHQADAAAELKTTKERLEQLEAECAAARQNNNNRDYGDYDLERDLAEVMEQGSPQLPDNVQVIPMASGDTPRE